MSTNFTMYSGDTKNLEITVKDEDDVAVDLTDCELFWELSLIVGLNPPLISKELGSGLTVVDAATGRFDIKIESGDTEGLVGSFVHEVRMIDDDDNVSTILQGTVTISAVQIDVTP